jgi:hypothetical protein
MTGGFYALAFIGLAVVLIVLLFALSRMGKE